MSTAEPPRPDEHEHKPQTADDWDARYVEGRIPWDTNRVHRHLVETLETRRLAPGRALELGCGTGTDAVWLAQQGWTVTGVDLSSTAIERARARAAAAQVEVDFRAGSFPDREACFDLIYDCGCFHTLDDAGARNEFVARAAAALANGGRWLSVLGSTDGPDRDHGPPRRSARDIVAAVEPHFEILSLDSSTYDADIPSPARAWVLLVEKRA